MTSGRTLRGSGPAVMVGVVVIAAVARLASAAPPAGGYRCGTGGRPAPAAERCACAKGMAPSRNADDEAVCRPKHADRELYKVRITSIPLGATVHVGNEGLPPVGVTPWDTKLAPTTYTIILDLDGYESAKRTITVGRSPRLQHFHVDLVKTPLPWGEELVEVGGATPAPDPTVLQEATDFFDRGNVMYKANDFALALPFFQRADSLVPGPVPKYKIAVCLEKLGKKREAVAAYQAFLDSKPKAMAAEVAVRIKELDEELEQTPATVTLQLTPANPPGLTVWVDGTLAPAGPLQLAAGGHTVVIAATGFAPKTRKLRVKGGEKVVLRAVLKPL